jgi:hypothetical protein
MSSLAIYAAGPPFLPPPLKRENVRIEEFCCILRVSWRLLPKLKFCKNVLILHSFFAKTEVFKRKDSFGQGIYISNKKARCVNI